MEKALFHCNGRSVLGFPYAYKSHPLGPTALAVPPKAAAANAPSSHRTLSPYWDSINLHILTHLEKSIPARAAPSVSEPLRRLALAAPRTSEPALCVAACELVGGSRNQALDAAAALHLVHAAAFLHDNLPLTDQPNSRPAPRPTAHLGLGPNIELLTGDGMVPLALELLGRSNDPAQGNSGRILRAMVEIMRAVGSQGAVTGRYYGQMGRVGQSAGHQRLESWVDQVCDKREGGLHACGGACGAILGGGAEEEIERLRAYGYYVGMIRGIDSEYGGTAGREHADELKQLLEEMRRLAIMNLKGFDGAKAEEISSILWT